MKVCLASPSEVEVEFHEWGTPVAESMPTALDYVEEFVEQSPNWPLTP